MNNIYPDFEIVDKGYHYYVLAHEVSGIEVWPSHI